MPLDENAWDPRLYEGSAPYYARGRLPYPPEMAAALHDELALDGTGRLIDLGCGPGSVALLLAPFFAEVVGVDPDAGMIAEAGTEAALRGVENARWMEMPAEALPDDLGSFRVATLAQSFHWMDRKKVAPAVRGMLEPAGSWVHINATTHRGVDGADDLPLPPPPHAEIGDLIHEYLGPTRRAGTTTLTKGTPAGEDAVMVAAGFFGPRRVTVAGHLYERSEEEVVASVFSLSWAAPHLFAGRIGKFETELRRLLRGASPDGRFAERARGNRTRHLDEVATHSGRHSRTVSVRVARLGRLSGWRRCFVRVMSMQIRPARVRFPSNMPSRREVLPRRAPRLD